MRQFLKSLLPRKKHRKPPTLDDIIPAEIRDDAFYRAILRLAATEPIRTILEIGSSAGEGSTRAFVEGILQNPARPRLYCMEVSEVRFGSLRKTYEAHDFVRPFHLSSVPVRAFPAPEEVERFYREHATNLNHFPLERVLGWLQADLDYLAAPGKDTEGIRLIREAEGIDRFDMVLIDGSEFTGRAELKEVLGASLIMLDDINVFKNYENYHALKADPAYRLEEEDWALRNGYAIFRKQS
jgi:hypothetical protein